MKHPYLILLMFLLLLSCEDPKNTDPIGNSDDIEQSDDILLPAELILSGQSVCEVERIDSIDNYYHVYFDGNECSSILKKYGEMEITLIKGNSWKDKNAVAKVTYINYTSKRDRFITGDSKVVNEIIINGTEYMTNLSGGDMKQFSNGKVSQLKRRYVGKDLTAAYNREPKPKQYSRVARRDIMNTGGVVKMITSGDTTINGYSNVQEWGINRTGKDYINAIDEPMVKTFCYARWILTSGKKTQYFNVRNPRYYLYGVDKKGNTDGTCDAYGYKVNWENEGGYQQSVIYSYFYSSN